jgi:DNA ligase-1
MNFVDALRACESASGAGKKAAIRAALATMDGEARLLTYLGMTPYMRFGVKKYDEPARYADQDPETAEDYIKLLNLLADRELTGNEARQAVTNVLSSFTRETAGYLSRILDKDLAAGFSADTFNDVWPDATDRIPVFDVMLADKCEGPEEFEKYVPFPCQADVKYDGERTVAIVTRDGVTYYSRSGLEARHCEGIFDDELRAVHAHLGYDFVLDGERFATDWNETMNAKKTGAEGASAKAALRFLAFFLMPLSDWMAKSTAITMGQTRAHLADLIDDLGLSKIILTRGRVVTDYADMMAYLDEVTAPLFDGLPKGHEGLILKGLDAVYEWDRRMTWCKVKKFYDADCRVLDVYAGKAKTRLAGTMGGLTVAGLLEDGTRVECDVGSGFSDELRREIWGNPSAWVGATIVVKYQEVTKPKKGREASSLRFPVFTRRRDDKVVELDGEF